MTGQEGRPEIIIMGSNDGKDWKEYDFYYKPGNISNSPQMIMPHQPRFDW
jgi:hypothetical protein